MPGRSPTGRSGGCRLCVGGISRVNDERIAQVPVGDAHQLPQAVAKAALVLRGCSCSRSRPWRSNTSRGSQQAPRLRSSHRSLRMLVICRPWPKESARRRSAGALLRRCRAIGAEQLGEHLPDHAGDVIAVAVQIAPCGQAAQAGVALEMVHALAHQLDAALRSRRAARGSKVRPCWMTREHVAHQVALRARVSLRQPRRQSPRPARAGSARPPTTSLKCLRSGACPRRQAPARLRSCRRCGTAGRRW